MRRRNPSMLQFVPASPGGHACVIVDVH